MLPGMPPAAPRFSVVTAAYDVERYLPEFIACLEAQTFDLVAGARSSSSTTAPPTAR